MKANANDFRSEGETMLGINPNRNVAEKTKEYVSFFGTTPIVVAELWNPSQPGRKCTTTSPVQILAVGVAVSNEILRQAI